MKRTASDLENDASEAVQSAYPIKRIPNGPNVDHYTLMAEYHKQKYQAMEEAFSDEKELTTKTRPKRPDCPCIRNRVPALSNDAIADILKQTKPDCDKAHAFVMAQGISNEAKKDVNCKKSFADIVSARRMQARMNHVANCTWLTDGDALEPPRETPEVRAREATFNLHKLFD